MNVENIFDELIKDFGLDSYENMINHMLSYTEDKSQDDEEDFRVFGALDALLSGLRVGVEDSLKYESQPIPIVEVVSGFDRRIESFELDCIPQQKTEEYLSDMAHMWPATSIQVAGYKRAQPRNIDYIRAIGGDLTKIIAHLETGEDVPFELKISDLDKIVGYFMDVPTDILESSNGKTMNEICECIHSCDKSPEEKITIWNQTLDDIVNGLQGVKETKKTSNSDILS